MKEIAHSYVAEKITGKKEPNLYIGCLLPDLVPYTQATEALKSTDLHGRGGEKFFDYLKKKAPQDLLLAVGVLCHGRLYGADRYNDVEYRGGPGYAYQKRDEKLIENVYLCSGIAHKVAPVRSHNFIELGLDYLLLQKEPELVERIGQALNNADLEKIAQYLSDCFQKDKDIILAGLRQLFSCYNTEDLKTLEGLAKIWSRQAAGLPEHDRVDVEKAVKVIERAAKLITDDFEEFLDYVVVSVKENLAKFLGEL